MELAIALEQRPVDTQLAREAGQGSGLGRRDGPRWLG